MLKFKVIEKYYPPKKTLELFNAIPNINLEITNGYARVIERTNIKQVFPVIYYLDNLTIYEFPKEYAKKEFYIVNNNTSYNLNELKAYMFCISNNN
jgi:hypothetical protein